MTVSYEIFPSQRLIITYLSGIITEEDFIQLREMVLADPQFHPDFSFIDDITGTTDLDIGNDRLYSIAQQTVANPGIRRALVAENNYQYGMARMYKVFSENAGQNFQVFRTLEEAVDWVRKPVKEN